MNVELLQQIKVRILAEPDAFRMDTWTCGTAHCIAGWALLLTGSPIVNPEAEPWLQQTTNSHEPGEAAAEALGLSTDIDDVGAWDFDETSEAGRLFHVTRWPRKFEGRYEGTEDRAERAQIAADRIDHFIATEGRE